MKNSKVIFQEIVDQITLDDSVDEIQSVALLLMEHLLKISRTDIMAGKVVSMTPEVEHRLNACVARVNRNEPVQYVVGEAFFYGRAFQVNPSVLIPRPETEEIVRSVLFWKYSDKRRSDVANAPRILDIGTGSGCIPVTLYLEWPGCTVYATDISTAALSVGVGNAELYDAKVNFIEHDILHDKIPIGNLDVIVSNPPYVLNHEKHTMRPNVVEFEPHEALFVPDDDPMIYYKQIIGKAKQSLNPGGLLAVEINEKFGKQVSALFSENNFSDIEVIEDVAGKHRVVRGVQPVK